MWHNHAVAVLYEFLALPFIGNTDVEIREPYVETLTAVQSAMQSIHLGFIE